MMHRVVHGLGRVDVLGECGGGGAGGAAGGDERGTVA